MTFVARPAALAAAALLAVATPAAAQTPPAAAPPAPVATAPAAPVAQSPVAPVTTERSWALNVGLGVVFPGSVSVSANGNSISADTETGLALRAAADFFVTNRLSLGVYAEYVSTSGKYAGQSADLTMTAFGGTFVGRFGEPSAPHFRAGLGLAYQTDKIDMSGMKDAHGFGISPFVDYVYPTKDVALFGRLGLNAQPSGGNSDIDLTWGPIFQLMIGAEFGK